MVCAWGSHASSIQYRKLSFSSLLSRLSTIQSTHHLYAKLTLSYLVCLWTVQKTKVCIPYQWYLRLIISILWVTVCNTIKNTNPHWIRQYVQFKIAMMQYRKNLKIVARGLPRMFLFTFAFHPLWRTKLWRKLHNQLNIVSICNLFQVRSDYLDPSETTFIPRNIFVILFLGSTYIPNLYIILYHQILFSANGHRLVIVLVW